MACDARSLPARASHASRLALWCKRRRRRDGGEVGRDPLRVDVELDRAHDPRLPHRVGERRDAQILAAGPDRPTVCGDSERRARDVGAATKRRAPALRAVDVRGDLPMIDQQCQVLADRRDACSGRRDLPVPAVDVGVTVGVGGDRPESPGRGGTATRPPAMKPPAPVETLKPPLNPDTSCHSSRPATDGLWGQPVPPGVLGPGVRRERDQPLAERQQRDRGGRARSRPPSARAPSPLGCNAAGSSR